MVTKRTAKDSISLDEQLREQIKCDAIDMNTVIACLEADAAEILEPVYGNVSMIGGELLKEYKMLVAVKERIQEKLRVLNAHDNKSA